MALAYHTHSDSEASGPPINQLVLAELMAEQYIVVGKHGNDNVGLGTLISPVLTITKALTLIDGTRKQVLIFPGVYLEATTLTIPDFDCGITGLGVSSNKYAPGGVIIDDPTSELTTMYINPSGTGTRQVSLSNLTIRSKEQVAGVYALHVEAQTAKKIYLYCDNVGLENHTDYIGLYLVGNATEKLNVWWNDSQINGKITCVWANNFDRLWMKSVRALDGIYTSGAVTGTVLCEFCILRPGAYCIELGHASNVGEIGCCVGFTGQEVYAEITDHTGPGDGSGVNGTTAF